MQHPPTHEQIAIIKTRLRAVVVSAVAGSGKTETLCARVRHLLAQGVGPHDILILSFSNKAVSVLHRKLGRSIRISTFHALGKSLVEQRASFNGKKIKIATPRQSLLVLRAAITKKTAVRDQAMKLGIDLRTKFERQRLFKFLCDGQGNPSLLRSLAADAESPYSAYASFVDQLLPLVKRYNELLRVQGLIDYGAMLRRGRFALAQQPLPYTYLFVDEYQDMSGAQARLLSALSRRTENVMIFGDSRQAIFGFAGGIRQNMEHVLDGPTTMPLTRSFRLTHQTAALVNAVIGGRNAVIGNGNGMRPSLTTSATAVSMENEIVTIVEGLKTGGIAATEIAILARTKAQLRLIEQALITAGHHATPAHSAALPAHTQKVLSIFTLLNRNANELAQQQKLSALQRRFFGQKLLKITQLSVDRKVLNACLRHLFSGVLAPSPSGRYEAATRLYLYLLRSATGERKQTEATTELGRWAAVSEKFRTSNALRAFISKLRAQVPVTLSTIHAAKGDEWDHVIVAGVTDGSIPFYREISRGDIEEERRLFYVAVTRARTQVHLIHAPFHHAPSKQSFSKPSRFLTPTVRNLCKAIPPESTSAISSSSSSSPSLECS
ncbi:ATP-dependent helicase [Paraburkholderia sediminicola]|uniref:ATP-dependent helicase n=1 Tax=Paraburkholderia sediminicola TaxID=458836 RepID=UPI0038BC2F60